MERGAKQALFLLLPFLVFVAVFMAYPLTYSAWLTFNDMQLTNLKPTFIGLANWVRLASDPTFLTAASNTIVFLVLEIAIAVPGGMGLALLLNQNFKGRSVIRSTLLLPWATPPIVMAIMFTFIFDGEFGVANYALLSLHLISKPSLFFANPHTALLMLVLVASWKNLPLSAFIILAGLQGIPAEVMESALVYKAGTFTRFRYIIFQYLKPTLAVVSILIAILSVQVFDVVIGITNGGPGYSTYMLYFLAYLTSFPFLHLGYGATIAYVVSIIAVLFAFGVLRAYKVD